LGIREDDMGDWDFYDDPGADEAVDDDDGGQGAAEPAPADAAGAASAGDGLPGVPVEGYPGLRAGAFAHADNLLGLIRTADLTGGDDSAEVSPTGVGPLGLRELTPSPLTTCPVPGHTSLLQRNPATKQGDGRFGPTRNQGGKWHWGVDYDAPVGSPVVAAGDGTVVDIKPNPSPDYGHQVVVDHGDGVYTQSAHLDRVDVKPGQKVIAGQPLGASGRSGNARKVPQVHFEVRTGSPLPRLAGGNKPSDPSLYLPPWCFR
jgi:murein DD-endopeptidase MepM/ murein hydrolase activator NlpD